MAKRDETVYLEDILSSMNRILQYVNDITEREFENNSEKQDAVIRRIEIIGEATKRISEKTRIKYPEIPWREMAGTRDVVIHEYFGVSVGLIWKVATSDIPALKPKIELILRAENE